MVQSPGVESTAYPWQGEFPVDIEGARALIGTQFPDLSLANLELLGSGWDNDVWLTDGWAFRFPRRAFGAQAIETELEVLPWLASKLPLAIPRPQLLGIPQGKYPARFYGHRKLEGEGSDTITLSGDDRGRLAGTLAGFLRALHGVEVGDSEEGPEVPLDGFRSNLRGASERALQLLASVAVESLSDAEKERIIEELTAVLPDPGEEAAVLLHGDLYSRHLLIDDGGSLAAVIDWGDLCLGERALDLAVVYSWLPPPARQGFFGEYGEVSGEVRERARRRALSNHGVSLLCYACQVGDSLLESDALRAIRGILESGP